MAIKTKPIVPECDKTLIRYRILKKNHPDGLILFRNGNMYEVICDDIKVITSKFNIGSNKVDVNHKL